MNIDGKDIPPDWLVQVKIEAEGETIGYRNADADAVIAQDYSATEIWDYFNYKLNKATLEIRTLPDCPSDKGDEGEYLGSIEVKIADADEPDPPKNKDENLTGCTETLWSSFDCSIPSIKCEFLNDIRLQKQGIRLGPLYIPLDDFEFQEGDSVNMGDIEWFMEGAPFDPDDYCPDCPDCPGLFRDLWEDLDYILRHTKKDMPKTINYLVSFGPDIQSEILDMIAHMPEEKRQNILCDQQLLQAYL